MMSAERIVATEQVLGRPVTLRLILDDADDHVASLMASFAAMAADINRLEDSWSPEQADTFRLTQQITVFRKIRYQHRTLTRSFMAQRERDFHWTLDEFKGWEPPLRRPTAYFHDAWHVHQFITDGQPPDDEDVLIDREQDAMAQQLDVARTLGCDTGMIDWLADYANDRERIRERLASGLGIGARLQPHFLVL